MLIKQLKKKTAKMSKTIEQMVEKDQKQVNKLNFSISFVDFQ